MADFSGELFTSPNPAQGDNGPDGTINGYPNPTPGDIGVLGDMHQSIAGPVTHYSLAAVCSSDGLRHFWTNTDGTFTGAPVCTGGYVSGTLTLLGSWVT